MVRRIKAIQGPSRLSRAAMNPEQKAIRRVVAPCNAERHGPTRMSEHAYGLVDPGDASTREGVLLVWPGVEGLGLACLQHVRHIRVQTFDVASTDGDRQSWLGISRRFGVVLIELVPSGAAYLHVPTLSALATSVILQLQREGAMHGEHSFAHCHIDV
mmetsp:Transcript_5447/g.8044  ORF Transcript_5447/g.8044 Transcript_5447/m.8044 type:complete len:158 (+) Transcript_5447:347-820(+)